MTEIAVKRTRDKEKTRADLLRVGEELFATHGFAGASLDQIAAAVGVNKALIAYYFKNKNGLYRAIISDNVSRVKASLADHDMACLPAKEAMQLYIRALTEAMGEHPHFMAMIAREHLSDAFVGNEESAAELLGFFKITASILDRGIEEGVFKEVDYHLFHLTIVGAMIYFMATERHRQTTTVLEDLANPRPSLEGFIRHTTELLLNGLLKKP